MRIIIILIRIIELFDGCEAGHGAPFSTALITPQEIYSNKFDKEFNAVRKFVALYS